MLKPPISAEIIPKEGKAEEAAKALQKLGFKILHVGVTISVEGQESLWKSEFKVCFRTKERERLPEVEGTRVDFRVPELDEIAIPARLQHLVSLVAFVEPPQFY